MHVLILNKLIFICIWKWQEVSGCLDSIYICINAKPSLWFWSPLSVFLSAVCKCVSVLQDYAAQDYIIHLSQSVSMTALTSYVDLTQHTRAHTHTHGCKCTHSWSQVSALTEKAKPAVWIKHTHRKRILFPHIHTHSYTHRPAHTNTHRQSKNQYSLRFKKRSERVWTLT